MGQRARSSSTTTTTTMGQRARSSSTTSTTTMGQRDREWYVDPELKSSFILSYILICGALSNDNGVEVSDIGQLSTQSLLSHIWEKVRLDELAFRDASLTTGHTPLGAIVQPLSKYITIIWWECSLTRPPFVVSGPGTYRGTDPLHSV